MVVGLEVPDSGDDVWGVVVGLAATTALSYELPVFEAGGDVFDAGPDPAVCLVVVVADDPAGGSRRGVVVVVMPRSSPLSRISWPVSRCATVSRATTTSLRFPGQQRPTSTTRRGGRG